MIDLNVTIEYKFSHNSSPIIEYAFYGRSGEGNIKKPYHANCIRGTIMNLINMILSIL